MPRQANKKWRRYIWFAPVLLLLLLFYGPFEQFRLLWINTAIYSSHYKFLATSLYTKKYIQSVLDKNMPALDRKTEPGMAGLPPSDDIRFAEIKGNYYKGYIIKVDDPRRLFLASAPDEHGGLLEELVAAHQGLGGINASGYRDDKKRGLVWGTAIKDGSVISCCTMENKHVMGGFTGEYKLTVGYFTDEEIERQGYIWAFEFGPLLIVNGEKTEMGPYSGGLSPRTAIGQTAEGHVLLVVTDGRQASSIGATYRDMQTILYANGAINAIGLDGGSSSTMVYRGALVNQPSEGEQERLLPNAIIFR
jgi:exopolysaccharide biosynthesis protein